MIVQFKLILNFPKHIIIKVFYKEFLGSILIQYGKKDEAIKTYQRLLQI